VGVNRSHNFSKQVSQDGNLGWKWATRNVGRKSGLGGNPSDPLSSLVHADCFPFSHKRVWMETWVGNCEKTPFSLWFR
jgi:hypothetical protein